jgi:hypothetical protein
MSVRKSRTCDGASGTTFAGGDHDEHFHDIIIDPAQLDSVRRVRRAGEESFILAAPALDDEDILVANRSLCASEGQHGGARVSATAQDRATILISTEVSPLLNFFSSTLDGF